IMIGSGFWVQANRHKSTWTRIKEALRLERSEVGHLATTFFRPSGAEIILEILAHFAYIDKELADSERKMIQAFADNWRLRFDWGEFERLKDQDRPASLVQARASVERYLKTSPPENQVAQLIDVLNALVKADNIVSDEEHIIMEEVNAQLLGYIGDADEQPGFTVVIAPQDRKQDSAIATLLPHARKAEVAGGTGYVVGTYFTRTYAEVICDQYRSLGFFTVDMVGGAEAPV
ncbi:MAG: TerB family tellurite resistance protein, partial [Gammaproteobacteria bacterium]|nr:TerB family tellurite resistance protein [Gammaproteobacteria bacterium]